MINGAVAWKLKFACDEGTGSAVVKDLFCDRNNIKFKHQDVMLIQLPRKVMMDLDQVAAAFDVRATGYGGNEWHLQNAGAYSFEEPLRCNSSRTRMPR